MERPRRFRLGFVLLGLLLLGMIVWFVLSNHKPKETKKVAPTPVAVAKAAVKDVPVAIAAIGSALPWQGVTIRTQVNGKLIAVPFKEGAYVKQGQLLAQIDEAPYRAVLIQAQGALKRDQALLAEARIDLKRYQTLVGAGLHRQAAGRYAGRPSETGRRHGLDRPGNGRGGPGERQLLPHRHPR